MADSSFAEFDLLSGLNTGDYLVGYRNIRETRVEISDLINNTLAVSLSTMSDMAKSNSVYSSVNSNSSNWNSNYAYVNANAPAWNNTTSNVNANSPFWSNYVNYLSTTNVRLSAATVVDGLSSFSLSTNDISARRINLVHSPANDGTNPTLFIGETDVNGTSGYNIFYDEILNFLTVTSLFSGVSTNEVTIDRFGNTTIYGSLSASPLLTDSLSTRQIALLHTPANDGTNPNIFMGETDVNGTSGFNLFYDEIQNRLTVTSTFSGVSGSIFSMDRSGSAFGPAFPYTISFVPFVSAAGATTVFYPAALSGIIPASEITSRIREGKGRINGGFLFVLAATAGSKTTAVRLQFANNVNFTSPVTIFQPDVAASNVSIYRTIEGFVCNNNSSIIFPSDTQASIYGAWSTANTLYPYGGDIFYRVGFNPQAIGQICSLSGAYISIVP